MGVKGGVMMTKKKEKLVNSINELTKKNGDSRSLSLHKYHANVEVMSKKIEKFAMELEPSNLLSVKMAVMGAARRVEARMKKNKEG